MRIDITSFFFNTTIPEATATAAWGTAICFQDKEKTYKIKDTDSSLMDLIIGMNYKVCSDINNLDISKMKTSELLFFSIFEKVYINNIKIENSFILLFLKEQSQTHKGRLRISYPNYASFDNKKISNYKAIEEFEKVLNINGGSWFVYDISVKNQDELHFSAIIVDANKPMTYKSSKYRGEIWKDLIEEIEPNNLVSESKQELNKNTEQKIFFGSPGTGKSYKVDQIISELNTDFFERVTFHPEFDNVSFVGGYKPVSDKDGGISYKFVPQAFTNIYERAWLDENNQYYLVIEEINRGNCAEIFGDIFQLLDRTSNYTVSPSEELKNHLIEKFGDNEKHEGIAKGLKLPPNLTIYATMNTSDQSLFPMDSAFKRRWEWEYVPINYEESNDNGKPNDSFYYKVYLDDEKANYFNWIDFIKKVNEVIEANENLGMDKCIGNYFIKSETKEITLHEFVNKVIFYLWNDVFKDEEVSKSIFEKGISFEKFFPINKNALPLIEKILAKINVEILPKAE